MSDRFSVISCWRVSVASGVIVDNLREINRNMKKKGMAQINTGHPNHAVLGADSYKKRLIKLPSRLA
jgi:hypothetical protein